MLMLLPWTHYFIESKISNGMSKLKHLCSAPKITGICFFPLYLVKQNIVCLRKPMGKVFTRTHILARISFICLFIYIDFYPTFLWLSKKTNTIHKQKYTNRKIPQIPKNTERKGVGGKLKSILPI